MKRYVEVYWAPWFVSPGGKTIDHTLNLLLQDPKPLIQVAYKCRSGAKYLECPSVIDNMKNCFVVTSPFDLNIKIDRQKQYVSVDRFGQQFFNSYVVPRTHQKANDGQFLLSLPPQILFYSHDPVLMQTSDLPIITSKSTKGTKLIVGQYDISKWIRPLEWSIEVEEANEIFMRKDDPLFVVRFNTKNNLPVKLIRVEANEELLRKALACVNVKKYIGGLRLKQLYELAKNYLQVK